jgi:hypothetical protein
LGKREIHIFRLAIKKKNATLVLPKQKHVQSKKLFKPFKKLFRSAGKLRNIQVEKHLLKDYGLAEKSKYLRKLDHEKKDQKKKFRYLIHSDILGKVKQNSRKIRKILSPIKSPALATAMDDQWAKFKKIIKKDAKKVSKLHVVRKSLRSFLLNAQSLSSRKFKRLTTLQHLLGQWHDRQNAVLQIDRFIERSTLKPKELKRVSKISSTLSVEKEKAIGQIRVAIAPLIGP